MRHYILALPILALSACSAIEQPYLASQTGSSYGVYDSGCSAGTCAPGQSYAVAGQNHNAFGNANPNHWPDQNLVAGYEHGGKGPVHVNPTGHGHYGQGVPHAGAYGQPPYLRGLRGQSRGNFYGTLGGVMYDTDIDSFGLEGRLGYDSGRRLLGASYGAELEGSLGILDEKDVDGDITTKGGFDYNVAAFAVARRSLTPRLSVHGRLGYDFRQLSVKAEDLDGNTGKVELDLDGIAYGIGAEYALSPVSGLRLDLTEYDNEFGASQSVSASFTRKF